MKVKIVIISLLLVIAVVLGTVLILKKPADKELSDIESFSFYYSNGYAMNSDVRYELKKQGSTYLAIIKPYDVPEDDIISIVVDNDFVNKLYNLLKRYRVSSWNGFNKTDPDVLDGDSFSISIHDSKGNSIYASGYMMYPDNYNYVENELDYMFMKIYNIKTGGSL